MIQHLLRRRRIFLGRRRCFSTNLLGCFTAVRVDNHNGMPSLLSARSISAGETLFQFTGILLNENNGDRCLQVGKRHWLTPEDGEPPWVFLNHSFEPSIHLTHPTLLAQPLNVGARSGGGSTTLLPPMLTATANVDLPPRAPLTIDYTLHEYEILAHFVIIYTFYLLPGLTLTVLFLFSISRLHSVK